MENLIHTLLLALHNIALVGCAAAPFYNRNLVKSRSQYGPKLIYELDKVVEDTLQGNAPYCITFIIVLFVTGIAIPFNHYLFHGAFKELSSVATIALIIKLLSVFAMVYIMLTIFFKINPAINKIFWGFSKEATPEPQLVSNFFKLRTRRKKLCEICLIFAIIVLVSSAFLGFTF
ncbi:MAG: hypothetical protein A2275_00190 [Bacteroidetes bacterium RIFOXYA12_FULL_35_11]|nr:MAG: hypothetical protein A2X01_20655 [Bacteroidetes bacterium GWF2_35_48]OFY83563.1 MAG: hypothetical protein A2275_00190 [Bacteroidetes bacterium RIFOXYA12_FULL_35_11]OFY97081.1 MAG: hypothetical protein A2309_11130 [Bacteroidetes bacterium RIFOXYB2_FULL_35_7]OFZ01185.1 MAG: hypothetical protein A2491_12710 [Bacteroidetes bacterium RIFOXYC12_FULL_35_7]HBX51775.1 hypothetical protein [Bacteroidales bacterium]